MRIAEVAVFAVAFVLSAQAQPRLCGKGEVCPEGECCLYIGHARWTLPSCSPLHKTGDACRPDAKPENVSVTPGPDLPHTLYTGVYRQFCPCQPGLQCAADRTCA